MASGIPKVISMLNSRYISVRYGHRVKIRAAIRAAAWSRVSRTATAYMLQPESAQNRMSVTL